MTIKRLMSLVTLAVVAGCSDQSTAVNQPSSMFRVVAAQPDEKPAQLTNIPISESGFSGTLSITRIAYDEGSRRLLLSGTVARASDGLSDSFTDVPGTLDRGSSASTSSISAITPAQTGSSGPCNFLVLAIQPLSLDLMGLTLELSIIRIDVTGVPGPDNSLGNFLCSLARLLDSATAATRAIQAQVDKINRTLATA